MNTINKFTTKNNQKELIGPRRRITISYSNQEADKIYHMERELMDYYGYDRSQLHKTLIRERYQQFKLL